MHRVPKGRVLPAKLAATQLRKQVHSQVHTNAATSRYVRKTAGAFPSPRVLDEEAMALNAGQPRAAETLESEAAAGVTAPVVLNWARYIIQVDRITSGSRECWTCIPLSNKPLHWNVAIDDTVRRSDPYKVTYTVRLLLHEQKINRSYYQPAAYRRTPWRTGRISSTYATPFVSYAPRALDTLHQALAHTRSTIINAQNRKYFLLRNAYTGTITTATDGLIVCALNHLYEARGVPTRVGCRTTRIIYPLTQMQELVLGCATLAPRTDPFMDLMLGHHRDISSWQSTGIVRTAYAPVSADLLEDAPANEEGYRWQSATLEAEVTPAFR